MRPCPCVAQSVHADQPLGCRNGDLPREKEVDEVSRREQDDLGHGQAATFGAFCFRVCFAVE